MPSGDAFDDDRRQIGPRPLRGDEEAALERGERPVEPLRLVGVQGEQRLSPTHALRPAWRAARPPRRPARDPPCAPAPRRGARRPPRPRARRAGRAPRRPAPARRGSPGPRAGARRGRHPGRGSSAATRPWRARRPARRPGRRRRVRPPATISRASARVSSTTSGGPPPCEHLHRLAHLERVAGRQAERGLHVGEQGNGRAPPRRCRGAPSSRASSRAWPSSFMNAPEPDLDVEHERAGALGDLLAHDGGGDERHARHGARDVAQRIQLLVGGREPRAGCADDRADVLELREHLLVGQRRRAIPGSTRACRACHPCARARAPRAAAPPPRTRRRAVRAGG